MHVISLGVHDKAATALPTVPPIETAPALPVTACPTRQPECALEVFQPTLDSTATAEIKPKVDRLSGETELQWDRFLHWLMVPDGVRRSLKRTAAHYGVHHSTIAELADKRDWYSRGAEYDKRRVRVAAEQTGKLAAESAVSQYSVAAELVNQAHALAQRAADAMDDDPGLWASLAGQAARILDKTQLVQRRALGLSTSNVSMVVTDARQALPDLRHLTDDELRAKAVLDDLVPLLEAKIDRKPLTPTDAARLQYLAQAVAKVAA